MKTNDTFILLKPEEAETLFITQDRDIALDILKSSTPESLSWCELELNEEVQESIYLYLDEWIDMNDIKIPYKRIEHGGFAYDPITVDEFVIILRDYPDAASKLIELSDLRKYPVLMEQFSLLAAELEREVYEIYQKFPLKDK
ncbi:hypothetical protein F0M03_15650 [Vibrio parahaemolyticus]|nr:MULTISPECIES: hypothetical protein [Vibrio]MCR9646008.1 hypothetical protein [Vibrio parahaemolyticus]MCR9798784.1 hypothetical protein [Vibrio parahaemolyticus]MDW2276574.1 hypothetical protein [Vibrio sp. 1074]MDW2287743.1 hypothetical protein [Vibrio sp. 1562]MDW3119462.1 hypothetical protein [Vibrio sp. 1974]